MQTACTSSCIGPMESLYRQNFTDLWTSNIKCVRCFLPILQLIAEAPLRSLRLDDPMIQAARGSFSAYAYEVLPLMHTLLSNNHLEPEQFRNDSLAFLRGFRGHSSPLMREFANKAGRGLKGADAAGPSDHAHSLVKVGTPLCCPQDAACSKPSRQLPTTKALHGVQSSVIWHFTSLERGPMEWLLTVQVPLVVARYAGDAELADRLAAVIAVHQTNEDATLAGIVFSAILERMGLWGATLQVLAPL
jgi:hypothetical protein